MKKYIKALKRMNAVYGWPWVASAILLWLAVIGGLVFLIVGLTIHAFLHKSFWELVILIGVVVSLIVLWKKSQHE